MKPSELFGVAVRVVGLLITLSALWSCLLGAVGQVAGLLIFSIPALVVGLFLMRGGARVIVRFAYPNAE